MVVDLDEVRRTSHKNMAECVEFYDKTLGSATRRIAEETRESYLQAVQATEVTITLPWLAVADILRHYVKSLDGDIPKLTAALREKGIDTPSGRMGMGSSMAITIDALITAAKKGIAADSWMNDDKESEKGN